MAAALNEEAIKALAVPAKYSKVYYFAGAVLQGVQAPRGFGVRVTPAGAKAFVLNYRLRGREYRYTIGQHPDWKALRAVREARELRQRVDRGENPLEDRAPPPAAKTVAEVLDEFMTRYVDRTLRSAKEYRSAFDRLVKPRIGSQPIADLRRSQVVELLDRIEDDNGPVMADRTLAYLRKAFNWYAARDDHFIPPIVKGMARVKPSERARDRTLTDDEIREVWPLLRGTWGAFVKMLLLTAQRRSEVACMARSEIDDGGVWTIPAERYKTKRPNVVPLSQAALALIEAQPRVKVAATGKDSDYVFPSRTGSALPASGKPKDQLDSAVATARSARGAGAMPGWTIHDLRRTARTLMTRAGVRPDIAERVLGHAISGVAGVYDRHNYLDEKRDALEKLAAEFDRILHDPTQKEIAQ